MPDTGCRPFSNTIQRENGRLFKRRWKKSAGCVRLMMVEKYDASSVLRNSLLDFGRYVKLLFQPKGQRLSKRKVSLRGECQIGFDQPFEFGKWFVIEPHIVQLLCRDPRLMQTEIDCMFWKRRIMFLSREPLFLGCRNDLTIHHQRSSRIMIEGGYSENRCHQRAL